MRKLLLMISSFAICGYIYAQNNGMLAFKQLTPLKIQADNNAPDIPLVAGANKKPAQPKVSSGTVVWSEDFGSGFPTGWTLDDKSNICPWVYSTDGSWGYFNGNSGTKGGTAIASTTASNGFLIVDPDSANNATYGQPSGTTYTYLESYVITDAIDLSAYPAVILEFEQYFRYNNGVDLLVSISTNKTTWTDFAVQGTVGNNTASSNAAQASLNISQIAGGQSTVYIKFGWSARVYFWMIDDIKIVVPENNDMELAYDRSTFGNYYITSATDSFAGDAFISVPISQVQSVYFRGAALNNGASIQTNVTLSVDISSDTQTGLYSDTKNGGTIAVADTTVIDLALEFTPTDTGNYYVSFLLSQDSTDAEPDDNLGEFAFEVTDTVYARDRGAMFPDSISATTQFGTGTYTGTADGGWKAAVYYPVLNDVTITSVTTFLGSSCEAGTSIQGVLMDANFDDILTTDVYDISSSDISKGELTIAFDDSDPLADLVAGDYILGIYCFENQDDVFLAYDNSTYYIDGVNFLYIPDDQSWVYFATESKIQPIIRMNFGNELVGIKENETTKSVRLEQNMPNPFASSTNIRYQLEEATNNVTINIYNVLGEKVASYNEGSKAAGKHTLQIDGDNLADGVYQYTLNSGNKSYTRKMTVAR